MPPDWILCLRHGEKPVGPDGEEGDGLSPEGIERGKQLVEKLGQGGTLLPAGSGPPSEILVPAFKGQKHRRAFDTMQELAGDLDIAPIATIETEDVGELATRVLKSTAAVVVICWEHDALVAWLHHFDGKVGVTPASGWLPVEWKSHSYDALWQLQLTPSGGYAFTSGRQGISNDKADARPRWKIEGAVSLTIREE